MAYYRSGYRRRAPAYRRGGASRAYYAPSYGGRYYRKSRAAYRPRRATYRRKSKKTTPYSPIANNPGSGKADGVRLSKFQLAQVDAFDPRVLGVKIPDSQVAPSCAVLASDDIALSAPITNAVCYAFQPSISSTMVTAVGATANTWTWPAAWAGNTTSGKRISISSNYDLFRPVAHGVRLSCSQASTAATGFVHIAVYPSRTTKTTWDFPTSIALMADCMWYTRVTLAQLTQTPELISNKFLDCTAMRYIDTSENGTKDGDNPAAGAPTGTGVGQIQIANEWCTILVALEGANNTAAVIPAAISAETLVHYEALPAPGGVQAGDPAAPYDVDDLGRASNIASKANPTTTADAAGQTANLREAERLAHSTGASVGTLVGDVMYSAGKTALRAGVNYAADRFMSRARGDMSYLPPGIPGVNTDGRLYLTRN